MVQNYNSEANIILELLCMRSHVIRFENKTAGQKRNQGMRIVCNVTTNITILLKQLQC